MRILDSHTGGEPTRLVVEGFPDLGSGDLATRRDRFRRDYDHLRRAIVCEPRGSDVVVGALLCDPVDPDCSAGVIFFNNVDVLNMCGHGTIGLVVSLAHLGCIQPGLHRIETPVGVVEAELLDAHRVRVRNVESYRHASRVPLKVPGFGTVHGDIAWGGNWFFLVDDHGLDVAAPNIADLDTRAKAIRAALDDQGIRGADEGLIDHIELFGPSDQADSRSFVLCPGGAWDRSPCGTGTSAKLACLASDGKLAPGETWRQESVIGSVFEASYEPGTDGSIRPSITGSAYVTAESTFHFNPRDPFQFGIPDGN